ncbi:glycine/betaine ABC transporter [Halobacteriales archaeon QS_8_69_26]|nr:MAG: glycine/betaine ABC transporter [Halobacteriales archaeon QS_8_69_26]
MREVSAVERGLRKVTLPVCALAGMVVVSGFFFGDIVGGIVSGRAWLVVSLLFFGSGLSYLALLPGEADDDDDQFDIGYLFRIRRMGPVATLRNFFGRHDPVTFGVPVLAIVLFIAATLVAPSRTLEAVKAADGFVTGDMGWLFVAVMLLSLVYCLALLVGPWGEIKLGGPDTEPTYTYPVYFTMFFTAGIAAGIVFWGPAEALFHYKDPPPFFGAEPQSGAAITGALTYALFHWGFSAWSAYIVVGVPIAYFVYERGAPLRVSTILTPFLGVENLDSPWCRLVDLLAVFATIGGIATSVALVSQQFLTGSSFQWDVTFGWLGPVVFVVGLTVIVVISAQSGIHRGIRRIAAINIVLFGFFAVLLVAIGPRGAMVDLGTRAVGSYAVNFVPMSLYLGDGWTWTASNWSWWFSWAPFAGLFLAALSRGRKIRTVVLTGLVATSAATMVWFIILGTTSLHLQHTGTAAIMASIEAYGNSRAVAGFPVFSALPLSQLLMFLFLALIIVFMVTSADTSTLVVSILVSKRGRAPTTATIVFWGLFQGLVALAVLLTGGEEVLQTAAVLTGGPFSVITLVALAGLTVALHRNERERPTIADRIRSALGRETADGVDDRSQ